jgi:hypothetical protein
VAVRSGYCAAAWTRRRLVARPSWTMVLRLTEDRSFDGVAGFGVPLDPIGSTFAEARNRSRKSGPVRPRSAVTRRSAAVRPSNPRAAAHRHCGSDAPAGRPPTVGSGRAARPLTERCNGGRRFRRHAWAAAFVRSGSHNRSIRRPRRPLCGTGSDERRGCPPQPRRSFFSGWADAARRPATAPPKARSPRAEEPRVGVSGPGATLGAGSQPGVKEARGINGAARRRAALPSIAGPARRFIADPWEATPREPSASFGGRDCTGRKTRVAPHCDGLAGSLRGVDQAPAVERPRFGVGSWWTRSVF